MKHLKLRINDPEIPAALNTGLDSKCCCSNVLNEALAAVNEPEMFDAIWAELDKRLLGKDVKYEPVTAVKLSISAWAEPVNALSASILVPSLPEGPGIPWVPSAPAGPCGPVVTILNYFFSCLGYSYYSIIRVYVYVSH